MWRSLRLCLLNSRMVLWKLNWNGQNLVSREKLAKERLSLKMWQISRGSGEKIFQKKTILNSSQKIEHYWLFSSEPAATCWLHRIVTESGANTACPELSSPYIHTKRYRWNMRGEQKHTTSFFITHNKTQMSVMAAGSKWGGKISRNHTMHISPTF